MLNSELVQEKCQKSSLLHLQVSPNVWCVCVCVCVCGGNLELFGDFKSELTQNIHTGIRTSHGELLETLYGEDYSGDVVVISLDFN